VKLTTSTTTSSFSNCTQKLIKQHEQQYQAKRAKHSNNNDHQIINIDNNNDDSMNCGDTAVDDDVNSCGDNYDYNDDDDVNNMYINSSSITNNNNNNHNHNNNNSNFVAQGDGDILYDVYGSTEEYTRALVEQKLREIGGGDGQMQRPMRKVREADLRGGSGVGISDQDCVNVGGGMKIFGADTLSTWVRCCCFSFVTCLFILFV
jgi:hypothetical protein